MTPIRRLRYTMHCVSMVDEIGSGKMKSIQRKISWLGLLFFLYFAGWACSKSSVYKSYIDHDAGPESAAYVFKPDASMRGRCGNGIIEFTEVCDDGNTDDDDTCSADCSSVDLCPGGILDGDFEYPNRNNFDLSDLSSCEQITGDLFLLGTSSRGDSGMSERINSLEQLKELTTIGGNLRIQGIPVTDLRGLEGLTTIGGDLIIEYNHQLIHLRGLNNLTSIGGGLTVRDNEQLTSLEGLDNLTTVEGDVYLSGGNYLSSLNCLPNLTHVGGDMEVGRSFQFDIFFAIEKEGGWEGTPGLESLKSIGGSLTINTGYLYDFAAFRNLERVGGDVWIESTASQDLNVFNNLQFVGERFVIYNNRALIDLFQPQPNLVIEGVVAIGENKGLSICVIDAFQESLRDSGYSKEVWICENLEDRCGNNACPGDHWEAIMDFDPYFVW